jgi:hypothetical protein
VGALAPDKPREVPHPQMPNGPHSDPPATFRAIEQALDKRLGKVRGRMLQDASLASAATGLKATPVAVRPVCAACLEGDLITYDRASPNEDVWSVARVAFSSR